MLSIQYRYNFVWIKYSQSYGKIASDTTQYFCIIKFLEEIVLLLLLSLHQLGTRQLEVPRAPNGASTHIFHMSYSNWN